MLHRQIRQQVRVQLVCLQEKPLLVIQERLIFRPVLLLLQQAMSYLRLEHLQTVVLGLLLF